MKAMTLMVGIMSLSHAFGRLWTENKNIFGAICETMDGMDLWVGEVQNQLPILWGEFEEGLVQGTRTPLRDC